VVVTAPYTVTSAGKVPEHNIIKEWSKELA
jgi:hypothetical protein